jgi:hypothetical protein
VQNNVPDGFSECRIMFLSDFVSAE